MKTNLILPTMALLLFASCDVEEFNENPNVPSDVPFSTFLPPTQKALADAQGGGLFRTTNIFSQQLKGVEGQEASLEVYSPDELFVGNEWSDLYVNAMVNLRIIIDKADAEGAPHYGGVARVQMAAALGLLCDTWGDVPYTQALQGSDFPNPAYDSQEFLYGIIQALLERAISDLSQAESVFSPGADDLYYGGNLDAWRRAARVLKARYYLRTTKQTASAASDALDALVEGGFGSDLDDFAYPYLGTGTDINPIFSTYSITPRALVDDDFSELIAEISDPREAYIFTNIPFSGGNKKPGDFYSTPAAPVKIASYLEELFIRAEALLRTSGATAAQPILEEAVRLSMSQLSSGEISQEDADAYIVEHAQLNSDFEVNLEVLITQKYIALFTSPEPWADFRRTGYPELV
ncbi:MAG TPA: SusD/RagB family nutrient-binding outer membrane lipoprotein, partial [Cryomorphaceae bacterium]|nr:SusD/RagB family nutrient-binding outer membrane lipoprotein [Cryomorphaceae bacterium]